MIVGYVIGTFSENPGIGYVMYWDGGMGINADFAAAKIVKGTDAAGCLNAVRNMYPGFKWKVYTVEVKPLKATKKGGK